MNGGRRCFDFFSQDERGVDWLSSRASVLAQRGIWANRAKEPALSEAEGARSLRPNNRAFGSLPSLLTSAFPSHLIFFPIPRSLHVL